MVEIKVYSCQSGHQRIYIFYLRVTRTPDGFSDVCQHCKVRRLHQLCYRGFFDKVRSYNAYKVIRHCNTLRIQGIVLFSTFLSVVISLNSVSDFNLTQPQWRLRVEYLFNYVWLNPRQPLRNLLTLQSPLASSSTTLRAD